MKKFIFYGILSICIFLIAACRFFEPEGTADNVSSSNVVYSPDGKVTVYFDENRAAAGRSLTFSQAVMGHDFFEAVFLYNTGSGYTAARANWRVGQKARINGVYRNAPGGVNYGSVSSNPAPGSGSAVLFAGKYSDKTLLAVGSICAVDDPPVTPLRPAVITTATKSVSFELNALKAGTKAEQVNGVWTADDSSFLTNSRGGGISENNTDVRRVAISFRDFPLFRMQVNQTVSAGYTIGLNINDGRLNANGVAIPSFGDYGIVVAAASGVSRIEPKFTLNTTIYKGIYLYDVITDISIDNNLTPGQQFVNPVRFTFDTTGTANNSVFSIIFEIPIYALSAAGDPVAWVIRPGYDEYLEDLDDGNGGSGGAVLLGTGIEDQYLSYRLNVINLPNKRQYNQTTTLVFDITGLILNIVYGNGSFYKSVNNGSLRFYYYNDFDVKTYIVPGVSFPQMNRVVTVYFEYDDTSDTGILYTGEYLINFTSVNVNFSDIPEDHRFLVATTPNLQAAVTQMAGGGNYLLVFSESVDIGGISIPSPLSAPLTIIITVNRPGIVLGRVNSASQIQHWDTNNEVFIFFGGWVYNEPIFIGGNILSDYPYTINAGGNVYDYLKNIPTSYGSVNISNVFIRPHSPAVIETFIDNIVTIKDQQYFELP